MPSAGCQENGLEEGRAVRKLSYILQDASQDTTLDLVIMSSYAPLGYDSFSGFSLFLMTWNHQHLRSTGQPIPRKRGGHSSNGSPGAVRSGGGLLPVSCSRRREGRVPGVREIQLSAPGICLRAAAAAPKAGGVGSAGCGRSCG